MDYLKIWTKQHLGQGIQGDQTESVLVLNMTFIIKVKLSNLLIDIYLDKRTLIWQNRHFEFSLTKVDITLLLIDKSDEYFDKTTFMKKMNDHHLAQ